MKQSIHFKARYFKDVVPPFYLKVNKLSNAINNLGRSQLVIKSLDNTSNVVLKQTGPISLTVTSGLLYPSTFQYVLNTTPTITEQLLTKVSYPDSIKVSSMDNTLLQTYPVEANVPTYQQAMPNMIQGSLSQTSEIKVSSTYNG